MWAEKEQLRKRLDQFAAKVTTSIGNEEASPMPGKDASFVGAIDMLRQLRQRFSEKE